MRGMITYIPLSVNLTTTQGCIRGLAHACVCVEEEEGGGGRGRGKGGGGCSKKNVHLLL